MANCMQISAENLKLKCVGQLTSTCANLFSFAQFRYNEQNRIITPLSCELNKFAPPK